MRRLLLPLLLLLAALLGAGYWLLATPSGLQWAWARLSGALGEGLSAASITGTLAGPLEVRGFSLRTATLHLTVAEAKLDWTPAALLRGALRFSTVEGRGIAVTLSAGQPPPETPSGQPFSGLPLPLGIEIRDADLTRMVVSVPERPAQRLARLQGGVDLGANAVVFHDLRLSAADFTLAVDGGAGLTPEAPLALQVDWHAIWPRESGVRGAGRIGGTLSRPTLTQQLTGLVEAAVRGELYWLDRPFGWRAEVELQRADLAALTRSAAPLQLHAGRLRGEGDGDALQLTASAALEAAEAGGWRLDLALERAQQQWAVPRFVVAARESPARAELSARWEQGATLVDIRNVEAHLSWREMGWPLTGAPALRSGSGAATLRGAPDHYRLEGALDLAVADTPSGRLSVRGVGDLQRLTFDTLQLEWLEGRAAGSGRLRWAPRLEWQAALAASGMNPGAAWPQWPGRLGGRVQTEGQLGEELTLRVELAEAGGTLRGYPVSGAATAIRTGERYEIPLLRLNSGSAEFSGRGVLAETWDFAWELAAPQLEQVLPDARGTLHAGGRLRGPRLEPHLRLSGRGEELAVAGQQVGRIQLNASAGLGEAPWEARLEASRLRLGGIDLARLLLTAEGDAASHRLQAQAQGASGELRLEAAGGVAAGQWVGVLRAGRFTAPTGEWGQTEPAALRVGVGGEASLAPWCWASGESRVCLQGARGVQGEWEGRLELAALPLAAFDPLLPEGVTVTGRANGHAEVGFARHLESLDVSLRAEEGSVSYPVAEQATATTAVRRLSLRASGEEGLTLRLGLELAEGGSARGVVELPRWKAGQPLEPGLPLQGRLQGRFEELGWITLLSPELLVTAGWLEADVAIGGTLGNPRLAGGAALREGALAVAGLGIRLEGLRVEMETVPEAVVAFNASARSGEGEVTVRGRVLRQAPGSPWALTLRATGERFEAVRLPQARVLVSPDLNLRLGAGSAEVSGKLAVPEAEIRLPQLQRGVSESPDVVIVNEPAAEPAGAQPPWQLTAKVTLELGERVRVSGYGFSGRLVGRLAITAPPDGVATGQGELRIAEGQYEAYGQRLTISEGRLLFANSPLDNPAVNLTAIREVREVTAGVRVSGRAQNPELELFSTPAMDESNILAYLVVGRPLSGASAQEAEVVRDAATSLGLAGGTRIAREVASEFGIEEVELQTGGNGQEAALVLGKYLSPELYVQYAVGLWETVNRLSVRYQLSEKWTFEVETGAQSGADLLYNIER